MSNSLQPHELQHARPPCPSPTPGVHSNSRWWCHLAISSSVIPFSSCPQSLPASESFLFTWGGQSTGVSALASILPKNTQDWSPLEWTGWISLQSKGLSRVFSNTRVQKHPFFGTQLSAQSNSHIHTWLMEKPQPWLDGPLVTHHPLNGHEFEQALGDGERQGTLACCSPWGRRESGMTERLNNNTVHVS